MSHINTYKKQLGDHSLSILRIFEVFCFILALIFVAFLFYNILVGDFWTKVILLIIASLLSILVLKQRILYAVFIKKRPDCNASNSSLREQLQVIGKFTPRTIVLLFSRTLVFNLISQAFPILLIDFIVILIASWIGHVTIDQNMWTLLGVIGVMLALFKYYVTSQQHSSNDAIEKLLQYVQIQIEKYTSHLNFIQWMRETKGNGNAAVIYINNLLDDHKYIEAQIKLLATQSHSPNYKKDNRSTYRLHLRNVILSNSPYINNSDLFFQTLESSNIIKDLSHIYQDFYFHEAYPLIIEDINDNYDLTEIGRIILTNINLLDESIVFLANRSAVTKFIECLHKSSMNQIDSEREYDDEIKSSSDAKNRLTDMVISSVIGELFKFNFKDGKLV